jgi:hypothetical protein
VGSFLLLLFTRYQSGKKWETDGRVKWHVGRGGDEKYIKNFVGNLEGYSPVLTL